MQQNPAELLFRAIAARSRGALSQGATTIMRTRARELISSGALDSIAGTAMAAQTADLLNFPVDNEIANDVPRWLSVLERPGPNAEGQAQTNLDAYMCIVAIKSEVVTAWKLLGRTISGLRSAVLAGELLHPAHQLLDRYLPSNDGNSWDLDKRIRIGLRQLRHSTGADEAMVAPLQLSDEDLNSFSTGLAIRITVVGRSLALG